MPGGLMDSIRSLSRDAREHFPRGGAHHDDNHHHSHLNPEFADSETEHPESERHSRSDHYVPTGRGGVGNLSHSRGRQLDPNSVDEDEEAVLRAASHSSHHLGGRGGVGNKQHEDAEGHAKAETLNAEEQVVLSHYEKEHSHDRLMGGRGGLGNAGTVTQENAIEEAMKEGVQED